MKRPKPWLAVVLAGSVLGLVFAAVSTYDFVQHLDRQVHSLHCSFIPGVSHAGESGCQVAMMSPYSSVLRSSVWGGIPISLAAMSVFAFLVFYTLDLVLTRRKDDPRATGFLALATALPAAASLIMLVVSLAVLGATCKLCVAIYIASAICLTGGIAAWRRAVREHGGAPAPAPEPRNRYRDEPAFVRGRGPTSESGARLVAVGVTTRSTSYGFLGAMFGIGVGFVVLPIVLYLALSPDHARFIGTCEGLAQPADSYGVMVRMDRAAAATGVPTGVPTIEVLDPLCPACRAFEQRLAGSGLAERLDRKAVLFPLDNTCNWMVTEATHPGACTVSEAVLCAGDQAPAVIEWAFAEQERVRDASRTDPAAAKRMVVERFPKLASCVGSPEARSRLNKSMRWIVANNIRVLTPQIFINGVKLCDEDVDLGLEYTLSTMLARHRSGALSPAPLEKPAQPPVSAEPASGTGSGSAAKATSNAVAPATGTGTRATERAGNPDPSAAGSANPPASGEPSAPAAEPAPAAPEPASTTPPPPTEESAPPASADPPSADQPVTAPEPRP